MTTPLGDQQTAPLTASVSFPLMYQILTEIIHIPFWLEKMLMAVYLQNKSVRGTNFLLTLEYQDQSTELSLWKPWKNIVHILILIL